MSTSHKLELPKPPASLLQMTALNESAASTHRSALPLWMWAMALHSVLGLVFALFHVPLTDIGLAFAAAIHYAWLAAWAFLPLLLAARYWPRRALIYACVFAGSIGLVLWVWSDHQFFSLYGYRLDGRTWRLMTTPGADDILDPGAGTTKTIRLGAILSSLLAIGCAAITLGCARFMPHQPSRAVLRWGGGCAATLLLLEQCLMAVGVSAPLM